MARITYWPTTAETHLLRSVLHDIPIPSSSLTALKRLVDQRQPAALRLARLESLLRTTSHASELVSALDGYACPLRYPSWDSHIRTVEVVTELAAGTGVELRFIKGVTFAGLWPWNVTTRTMSDVDVLVRSTDAIRLVDALLAAGWGWLHEPKPLDLLIEHDHSVDLVCGGAGLDIHWDLSDPLHALTREPLSSTDVVSSLWGAHGPTMTLARSNLEVPTVDPALQLLQLASKVRGRDWPKGLLVMLDAVAVLRSSRVDFDSLLQLASGMRCIGAMHELLEQVNRLDPSPGLRRALEQPVMPSRTEKLVRVLAGPRSLTAGRGSERIISLTLDWLAAYVARRQPITLRPRELVQFCRYFWERHTGVPMPSTFKSRRARAGGR